jgi:hypothetical protein
MAFDPRAMGFLWPNDTAVENAYDERMRIEPSAVRAGFDEANEGGRMALRLYNTPHGVMTENQVIQWVCGGPVAWMEILESIRRIAGIGRPTNLSLLRRKLSEEGVSASASDLTLLRLRRDGYTRVEGEGDASTLTIVRW